MNADQATVEYEMTPEERVRLSEFFNLLLRVDQRTRPELYLANNQYNDD
jgi:hypothetical protein